MGISKLADLQLDQEEWIRQFTILVRINELLNRLRKMAEARARHPSP